MNIQLSKKEFDVIYNFSARILTILSSIGYKDEFLSIDGDFKHLIQNWIDLSDKHFKKNYSLLTLLFAELTTVKRSKEYTNNSSDIINCEVPQEQWSSLRQTSHDTIHFCNRMLIRLEIVKIRYEREVESIRTKIKDVSNKYCIIPSSEVTSSNFMNNALWLSIYDICKYTHENQILFNATVVKISNAYFNIYAC